jgi:hypothetical protein
MEVWKDIKDYENLYQVSNLGRLRSNCNRKRGTLEWKLISVAISQRGYLHATLHKDGIRKNVEIHRLVAQAFIPNPDNLPQVNHKSENKQDNRVENLEWCTASYNSSYGTITERKQDSAIKTGSPKAKRAILCFDKVSGVFKRGFESAHAASRALGFSAEHNIVSCLNGKLKSAYGFVWKRAF